MPYDQYTNIIIQGGGTRLDWNCPVNWQHPLAQGLVGFWRAPPGNGGLTWHDLVRGGHTPHDGALSGTASTSGFRGPKGRIGGVGSWLGNGTDGYVDCGSPLSGTITQFTVAGWMYRASVSNLVVLGWGANVGNNEIVLLWFTDGNVYFQVENGSSWFPNCAFNKTGWHRFALAYNGALSSASRVAAYIDGQPKVLAAGGAASSANYAVTGNLRIGNQTTAGGRFSNGAHDDTMVWNRALSAQEFALDYQFSCAGWPGLLNYLGTTEYSFPSAAISIAPGSAILGHF